MCLWGCFHRGLARLIEEDLPFRRMAPSNGWLKIESREPAWIHFFSSGKVYCCHHHLLTSHTIFHSSSVFLWIQPQQFSCRLGTDVIQCIHTVVFIDLLAWWVDYPGSTMQAKLLNLQNEYVASHWSLLRTLKNTVSIIISSVNPLWKLPYRRTHMCLLGDSKSYNYTSVSLWS